MPSGRRRGQWRMCVVVKCFINDEKAGLALKLFVLFLYSRDREGMISNWVVQFKTNGPWGGGGGGGGGSSDF